MVLVKHKQYTVTRTPTNISLTSSNTTTHKWYQLRILLSIFKTEGVFQLIVGCKVYHRIWYCHHSVIEAIRRDNYSSSCISKSSLNTGISATGLLHSAYYSQITNNTVTFLLVESKYFKFNMLVLVLCMQCVN